ncbi:MAG TPA: hypothetical protein VF721_09960 [Pyrinomonadaceae bacterium]|jgi:serine protease inhibitor ecotin
MKKNLPPLRRIHSDETLEKGIARFSIKFWRKQSNQKIIESLQAGKVESLKVKSDGRILNGNVRCKVLEERGFDLNLLEREIIG